MMVLGVQEWCRKNEGEIRKIVTEKNVENMNKLVREKRIIGSELLSVF